MHDLMLEMHVLAHEIFLSIFILNKIKTENVLLVNEKAPFKMVL